MYVLDLKEEYFIQGYVPIQKNNFYIIPKPIKK